jgi:histone H3/H4
MAPLMGERIANLVKSLDPNYTIDIAAEEQLLQLADDFLDQVTRQSIRMAQHRGSKTLDVQDLQLVLAKQWGITVPGLGAPTFRSTKPPGRASVTAVGLAASGGGKRKASDASLTAGGSRAKKAGTGVSS